MPFLAIMSATPDGRVAKYQDFPTKAGADVHVARFTGAYPEAFVVLEPSAPFSHWRIDMAAKTITIDIPPPPLLPPENDEVQALRELAPLIGPAAVSLIDARYGAKPA